MNGRLMRPKLPTLAAIAALLITLLAGETAFAQKPGGVLRVAHRDSLAGMSTLEEVTISTVAPMMAVFSNLVIFDQHVPKHIAIDRAGSRQRLVGKRGRHRIDLSLARGRSL